MTSKKTGRREKAQTVLNAAGVAFGKYGYRRATIDQIAEAAGVAKGTVYLYYASKEDLFFALLEEMTRASLAGLPQLEARHDQPALARIEAMFRGVAASLEESEAMIPLTLEFWSACGVEETRQRFGGAFAQLFGEFRKALTAILEEGAASGEIQTDAPLESVASCLMAMIDGLIIQQWTDPRIRAADALTTALPVLLGTLSVNKHK